MRAFDKVIGYEKEKEELYQLCDMAKIPQSMRRWGKIAARHPAARRAGRGKDADGDRAHRRDGGRQKALCPS